MYTRSIACGCFSLRDAAVIAAAAVDEPAPDLSALSVPGRPATTTLSPGGPATPSFQSSAVERRDVRQEEIPEVRLLSPDEFAPLVRRAHLHPTTKLVALHMMTYASFKDGKQIYPGEETIAEELGRTTRCVREHLKILRDLRILTRVRHNSGRRAIHDEYWLSWPLDVEKIPMKWPTGDSEPVLALPPVRLFRRRPAAGESDADSASAA